MLRNLNWWIELVRGCTVKNNYTSDCSRADWHQARQSSRESCRQRIWSGGAFHYWWGARTLTSETKTMARKSKNWVCAMTRLISVELRERQPNGNESEKSWQNNEWVLYFHRFTHDNHRWTVLRNGEKMLNRAYPIGTRSNVVRMDQQQLLFTIWKSSCQISITIEGILFVYSLIVIITTESL